MFFKIFNQPNNIFIIRIITLAVLICFNITMNGCMTTGTVKFPRNISDQKSIIRIAYVVLMDGTKITTHDKKLNYTDFNNSQIVMNYDTIISKSKLKVTQTDNPGIYDTLKKDTGNIYNTKLTILSGKKVTFPAAEVLEVFVEKSEVDGGLTTLLILGIIAGVALTAFLVNKATEPDEPPKPPDPEPRPIDTTVSCPLVYSFDGDKYVFDAEPISGVISESLTRTDLSEMEFLNQSDGKFKLLVKNQPGEKEMIDELKLVCVAHEENTYITPNPEGEYFNYKNIIRPESVTDENGNDVSAFFNEKDNVRWQTMMPYDTSFHGGVQRHSLKFRFPKPAGAKDALIFVNCGTASWGGSMIKTVLQLKGEKVDDWYGNMLTGGKEMQKLFKFIQREELFWLNVNLLEGDKYVTRAYIPAGGPMMDEDRIIRLPLENVTGNFVEFNLSPPAGFWKIDRLGIIYDYKITGKDKVKELDAVFAKDQNGGDIRIEINSTDKNYYRMQDVGNYANIYYEAPPDFDKKKNKIFLKTTGYYEIYIDKGNKEQSELVEEILIKPGKIIDYSMSVYNKEIKRIAEYLNAYHKK